MQCCSWLSLWDFERSELGDLPKVSAGLWNLLREQRAITPTTSLRSHPGCLWELQSFHSPIWISCSHLNCYSPVENQRSFLFTYPLLSTQSTFTEGWGWGIRTCVVKEKQMLWVQPALTESFHYILKKKKSNHLPSPQFFMGADIFSDENHIPKFLIFGPAYLFTYLLFIYLHTHLFNFICVWMSYCHAVEDFCFSRMSSLRFKTSSTRYDCVCGFQVTGGRNNGVGEWSIVGDSFISNNRR